MGKILFSKKIGDTNFCISAAPIGGYVEVATDEGVNGSYGFNQISYWKKVCIMLGGIFCNFFLTYIIFVALFWTGMPDNAVGYYEPCSTKVSSILENSINACTLQQKDTLVSLNNQQLNNDLMTARKIIAQNYQKLEQIPAQIIRDGKTIEFNLHLSGAKTPPSLSGQLGVSFECKESLSFVSSLKMAYCSVIFYTCAIIDGLKKLFDSSAAHGFVGPLMAVAASSKSAQKGLASLLFFLAVISINLGFMNLLPLPIFDGGQFVIFTIEAILRRQLSEKIRNWIGLSSWVLAIGLLVIFTIKDLHHLIFG